MSILGEQTCSDGTRLYLRTGIEGYDPKIPCLYAKLPFQTAIPEEFRNKRFDWSAYSAYNLQARKAAADYCKDIVSNIENGKGLWICSESSGSGKSLLASAILGYAEKNGVKETMYISVSKMEEHGKESCDSSFWQEFLSCDLLVIDEAEEGFGKYSNSARMLRERLDSKKATIICSLETPEALFGKDKKTISRIKAACEIVALPNEDIRVKLKKWPKEA